jgi:hypothetical protein
MDDNTLNDNKSDKDNDECLQHEGIIFNPEIRQMSSG